jgi:hypothetical protein
MTTTDRQIESRWPVLVIVVVGLAVRAIYAAGHWSELDHDRDAYLAIAQEVAAGHGLATPGGAAPTAYRPPLYPILLAPLSSAKDAAGRAMLQILLGGLTVFATHCFARGIGMGPWPSLAAAGLVAVDPLLIAYTPQLMTETLATTLSAVVLWAAAPRILSTPRQIGLGLLLALACLCRPTFYPFAALLIAFVGWNSLRSRDGQPRQVPYLLVATFLAGVAPWPIRNQIQFGQPILTTTHGGYTLLLSNNPTYYDEVVRRPWGTEWDGASLERWQREQQAKMASLGIRGEVAEDQYYQNLARHWIGTAHPRVMLECIWHRVRSLWRVAPSSATGMVANLSTAFYAVEWILVLTGVVVVAARRDGRFIPAVGLIVTITAIHSMYFSNARMRAPATPALAILATTGLVALRRKPPALNGS